MSNKKLTISLSDKTLHVLAELREATDAYTDSEAVKNALYFHRQHLVERGGLVEQSRETK
jgi:hypothetical protein